MLRLGVWLLLVSVSTAFTPPAIFATAVAATSSSSAGAETSPLDQPELSVDKVVTKVAVAGATGRVGRLVVEELRIVPRTLGAGRAVMVAFMGAGTLLTLWGNATLFDAVAVSGTASMFLAPVLIVGLVLNDRFWNPL